jgi:hypothetical protein
MSRRRGRLRSPGYAPSSLRRHGGWCLAQSIMAHGACRHACRARARRARGGRARRSPTGFSLMENPGNSLLRTAMPGGAAKQRASDAVIAWGAAMPLGDAGMMDGARRQVARRSGLERWDAPPSRRWMRAPHEGQANTTALTERIVQEARAHFAHQRVTRGRWRRAPPSSASAPIAVRARRSVPRSRPDRHGCAHLALQCAPHDKGRPASADTTGIMQCPVAGCGTTAPTALARGQQNVNSWPRIHKGA